jgi:hypothetical protein
MNRSWMLIVTLGLACTSDPADDGEESSSGAMPGSSEGESSSAEASASSEESGSSESGTAEASSGESGGSPVDLACDDPQPLLQFDGVTPSGFVVCSDGFVHREEAAACLVPEAGTCDECDTDCSELTLGRCVSDLGLGTCSCVASCESDADCEEGNVCACSGIVGDVPRCVPAGCTTTADCGGGLCGISGSSDCGFDASVACLDATSECRVTTCNDDLECACYASGGEYVCHDECFSGCG